MFDYFKRIWLARYFWTHLALSDLRSRWRRSFFGIFWTIIQPLATTLLIALVFSKIFNSDITTYAPYILSGTIVWDFIMGTAIGGSLSFVQADAYIKQYQHPLAIYSLRTVLASLVVLLLASTCLIAWVLIVLPQNFGWSWTSALLIFPISALIAWPLVTILAYVGTRFRDLPHALGLIFQAMWFVSPIYFEEKTFRAGGLDALVDYNPIYHLLEVVRAPLLKGLWPTSTNYIYCLVTIFALMILALLVGRKLEKTTIFYL